MVAAFDSSTQQLSADGILLVLIIVGAIVGWRTGTVRRVLSFAGLYVGAVAAFYIGNGVASLVDKGSIYANAWVFIAVVVVVVVLFEVIGHLFADRLDRLLSLAFDRVIGMVVGAAVGFFQALLLFAVALAVGNAPVLATNNVPAGHSAAADAVRSAALAGHAIGAEPALDRILSPVLSTDLTTHFVEGTSTTSP